MLSFAVQCNRYIAKTLYGDDEEEETPQDTNDTNVDETKLLDVHPTSEEKIKDVDAIALEVALDLLRFPWTLGDHPKDRNPVILKIGRVG
ncbi:hypothetical protein Peur_030130 [Populus x canadensis]